MSDLAATNCGCGEERCGCGCENQCGCGCGGNTANGITGGGSLSLIHI